ncbi:hypothetical protein TTRE_0000067701 [Trichuris trichiura]|uniref:Uncharacterized protein n=1 Tax=Trichuris trichiura TaxID=36087 RepID=A0A077YY85_TRITR|nr:hypothetical protein TTRE_0000067701 [Trichuris trichiura]
MYCRVLQELEQLYGDSPATAQSHALMLTNVDSLRSESMAELESFYLQVNGPVSVLEMNKQHCELNSIVLLSQVCGIQNLREKLAHHVHSRWLETLTLRHFVDWLKNLGIEKRFLASCLTATKSRPHPRRWENFGKGYTYRQIQNSLELLSWHQCVYA